MVLMGMKLSRLNHQHKRLITVSENILFFDFKKKIQSLCAHTDEEDVNCTTPKVHFSGKPPVDELNSAPITDNGRWKTKMDAVIRTQTLS